ncbi:MAG: 16S rRNA (adenine(1518)-N(6)/adenine(1519)-N(6))-dimethyltransferase RsmA [Actinobacteria bacterium]|nr:16S rRNA (adenine(1518)-N(6)/adenine(1519)-N(6))-dimethyltransferase RsmA [Actinomycetota bacterium]
MRTATSERALTSPAVVRKLLNEAGIRPRRSLGQNFLIDANVLRIIEKAAGLSPSDTVIEVGAGLGALTQVLIGSCAKVFALESDLRLSGILKKELGAAENLVLVHADAARFDFGELREGQSRTPVKMVANLPYGIAATLIIDCLYNYPWIEEYTVMVQREIAGRLTSEPGSKDYSAATVKVHSLARVKRVAKVSRNSFYPPPRVDSTLLRIERLDRPGLPEGDRAFFDMIVTAGFHQRRKKLATALSTSRSTSLDREKVRGALAAIGRDPDSRAEQLSSGEFVEISRILEGRG